MKQPAVYIVASFYNGTLYVGVTSNLIQRIYQHKSKLIEGFSAKYGCDMLVYYEVFETMEAAIVREKQLKNGSRLKKKTLIETMNPLWKDLYNDIAS